MTLVALKLERKLSRLKISVLIALGLWAGAAFPWSPFGGKQRVFECPSYEAAQACLSSCKPMGWKIEFKVNVANNAVMLLSNDGEKESSSMLNGCKVVDGKNWECANESAIGNRYTAYINWRVTNNKLLWLDSQTKNGVNTTFFMCTK